MKQYAKFYLCIIGFFTLSITTVLSQTGLKEVKNTKLFYRIMAPDGWKIEKDSIVELKFYHEQKQIVGKLIVRYLQGNRHFETSEVRNFRLSIYSNLGKILDSKSSKWSGIQYELYGPDDKNVYSKIYYFSDWNYGYFFIFRSFDQNELNETKNIVSNFETFVPWENVLRRFGYLGILFIIAFIIGRYISIMSDRMDIYDKYIDAFSISKDKNEKLIAKFRFYRTISKTFYILFIAILLASLVYLGWKYGFQSWPLLWLAFGWIFGNLSAPSVQKIHSKVNSGLAGLGTSILWGLGEDKIPVEMLIDPITSSIINSVSAGVDIEIDTD